MSGGVTETGRIGCDSVLLAGGVRSWPLPRPARVYVTNTKDAALE